MALWNFFTVFCILFGSSLALYEYQIGTFDWKKEFVGKIDEATFESSISVSKHLYVSTERNVLACISARTGQVVWRKVLGESEGKIVHAIHLKDGLLSATSLGMARLWDSATGALKWEVDLTSASENREDFSIYGIATLERSYTEGNLLVALSSAGIHAVPMMLSKRKPEIQSINFETEATDALASQLLVDSSAGKIIHLQQQSGARLLVTVYSSSDLEMLSQATVDVAWLDNLDMAAVMENGKLVYVSGEAGSVHLVDIASGETVRKASLSSLGVDAPVSSVVVNKNKDIASHGLGVILVHGNSQISYLSVTNDDDFVVTWSKVVPGLFNVAAKQQGNEVYAYLTCKESKGVTVSALNLKTGVIQEDLTIKYKLPENSGSLAKVFINMYLKRNAPTGFRTLLIFSDESAVLVSHPNRAMWRREEALASITDATMMDLPLTAGDAEIEAEFEESEKTGILEMFIKRVKAQCTQVVSTLKQIKKELDEETLFRRKTRDPLIQVEALVRDPFSLHKMIVVVTKPGALFGIDSLTGDIAWRYFSDELAGRQLKFFVQRTTAHFPHPPQAVLLAVDDARDKPPIVMTFNPIIGLVNDILGDFAGLKVPFRQAMLSPFADSHHLRPLLLLDDNSRIHLVPDTTEIRESLKRSNLFMFDINRESGLIRGFSIDGVDSVQLVWSVNILKSHKIVGFAAKLPSEKIDSMGRPLADRSVIYKYLNPNAIAVLSESEDKGADRSTLMLHMIDAVTGQILYSNIHKKASSPVHMVHSENWLIYSYWNTKARRTELASLELYEGRTQYNDTVFSSFQPRPEPVVMHQAYIFPTGISCMGVSRTEKGITNRQILFGMKRGSLFGMVRRYFDPRRPLHLMESHKEEGLVQYMPEIPVPPELFLSYNLTLEQISAVYSAPAALESTSLVLATGLDVFFTRTQPSKMFDVLKEDFDHLFISSVLMLMFVGALVTRRMAQVKQLNKAWR